MTGPEKEDFCATLDALKEAIQNDRIVSLTEHIDYKEVVAKDGTTVERFVPINWRLQFSARVDRGRVMRVQVEMAL